MIKFGFLLDIIGSVIIYIFLILSEYAGWEIDDFYKGGPSDLCPQDDRKRLNDKHQRKGDLICHSEAGEESPSFKFLTWPYFIFKINFIKE
jgi:hypothetical protein